MADTFQNLDLEKINADVKKQVDEILAGIDLTEINTNVEKILQDIETKKDKLLPEERKYVDTLKGPWKDKTLRYLDIFRDHPEIVQEYLGAIKEHGSEKAAKEKGHQAELLYPYKLLSRITDNPEFEGAERRLRIVLFPELMGGEWMYDRTERADKIGKRLNTEYRDQTSVKIWTGVSTAIHDRMREVAKTTATMIDWGLDRNSLAYIEENWPEAQKTRKGWEKLADDLTGFGIDLYLGRKILGAFGSIAKIAAPNQVKRIVNWATKTRTTVKAGDIHQVSSVAQKLGYWGVTSGAAYGLGRAITADDKRDSERGHGLWVLDAEETKGLSGPDKATAILKNKLKYGIEGTALIGGLTVGFRGAGKYLIGPLYKAVAPPVKTAAEIFFEGGSRILMNKRSYLPPLIKNLRKGGAWTVNKIGFPPMEKWKFFSTQLGPWYKKKLLAKIDRSILTRLRTDDALTAEGMAAKRAKNAFIRESKKAVDLDIKQIEMGIYKLLEMGFKDRIFTSTTSMEGMKHWQKVIQFLEGNILKKELPEVLQKPALNIKNLIEKMGNDLKPFIESEAIKKEIVDAAGKYLTTSYKIFEGGFRPTEALKNKAVEYFVNLLKSTRPMFKNAKEGSQRWGQLQRLASQQVDDILRIGEEGSSPHQRLAAIQKIVAPAGILAEKRGLPTVIEELMGKVGDPRNIIVNTVGKQADLLGHLRMHQMIAKTGVNKIIFKDQASAAALGVTRKLMPIDTGAVPLQIDLSKMYTYRVGKETRQYLTTPEIAAELMGDALGTDFLLNSTAYKSFLAAKTTAQLSKTVLSLMTQTRNFETAMFFSMLNGHIGRKASVLDAMKLTFGEVLGKGNPDVMRKKLTEYLKYEVTDSSIVAQEVEMVMKDIISNKFTTTDQLFKFLLNNPVFRKATEFYQASDNVWKAYGYEFTKSQLFAAIPKLGLSVNGARKLGFDIAKRRTKDFTWQELMATEFKNVFQRTWNPKNFDGTTKTWNEAVSEMSGQYIKNVYPNYGMVPRIVRNWRRLPMGNFVAFQSEIIRNIFNASSFALREMSSANPFIRQMGARRMLGTFMTLYGFQKGMSVATTAFTNIDEDFLKRYQRFISPEWAKNHTLYAISKMQADKSFWTIDWSAEQPFESAIGAFSSMLDALFDPIKTDEAMYKRFFHAFLYNPNEGRDGMFTYMLKSFMTDSIFNEALGDIWYSPVMGELPGARDGVTRDGKIIYDPKNDDLSMIIAKSVAHLVLAITPTTANNAIKISMALEGKTDKAGNVFNTYAEVFRAFLGIGARKQNPTNSIKYVVNDLSGRIQDTQRYFYRNANHLMKLVNDPNNIIEQFDLMQKHRYREMTRVHDFIKLLRDDLGYSNAEINKFMKGKQHFSLPVLNKLKRGVFTSANVPSTRRGDAFRNALETLKRNQPEKYKDLRLDDILPRSELNDIRRKWMNVPLGLSDKQLDHYFETGEILEEEVTETEDTSMIMPSIDMTEQKQVASVKPQVPLNAANVSAEVIASKPDQNVVGSSGLTATETAWLSNEEKAMRLKQKGLA
jgi:hypothetical protein